MAGAVDPLLEQPPRLVPVDRAVLAVARGVLAVVAVDVGIGEDWLAANDDVDTDPRLSATEAAQVLATLGSRSTYHMGHAVRLAAATNSPLLFGKRLPRGYDTLVVASDWGAGSLTRAGYAREALPLVERFADVFGEYDAVVAPSGSCVGSVRHQHATIARRIAGMFAPRTPKLARQRTGKEIPYFVPACALRTIGTSTMTFPRKIVNTACHQFMPPSTSPAASM